MDEQYLIDNGPVIANSITLKAIENFLNEIFTIDAANSFAHYDKQFNCLRIVSNYMYHKSR